MVNLNIDKVKITWKKWVICTGNVKLLITKAKLVNHLKEVVCIYISLMNCVKLQFYMCEKYTLSCKDLF